MQRPSGVIFQVLWLCDLFSVMAALKLLMVIELVMCSVLYTYNVIL